MESLIESLGNPIILIVFLVTIISIIIITRFLGAWMLRIDEVIKNLSLILKELKDLNDKSNTILEERKKENLKIRQEEIKKMSQENKKK